MKDRKAWRRWIEKNHGTSRGVWLVISKKGATKSWITYDEAVEEALCFGWIDSRQNPHDEERYKLYFSPRRRGGTWSKSNKQRAERLLRQRLIAPAGLEEIEAAKRDGSWNMLDAVEELRLPEDLRKALAADKTAEKNFHAFSPSSRRRFLWWIESAKRPETRAKRIAATASMAEGNRRPD